MKQTTTSSKLRNACLTINNWTDDQYATIVSLAENNEFKYIVIGKENAPTTGTPHLHIYAEFKNPRSVNAVSKMFFGLFVEPRDKTAKAASEHCKKGGDFVEYGKCSSQGKRMDLDEAKDVILTTGRMADIVDKCNLQVIKTCEKILTYKEPKRSWKPEVLWFYGKSGAGKTRKAREMMPDPWISGKNLRWWEGYDAHEDIIIDDFRADFCTFHEFLRILDRYEYRVEVKGGSRQLLAKRIIITSCHHPTQVYNTREDIYQLERRIDRIELFGDEPVETKQHQLLPRPKSDPIVKMPEDDNDFDPHNLL